jgi:cell division protein FtsB
MKDSTRETTTIYRSGILVLVLASIALIVHNIFGQNGYLTLRRQQKQLHTIQQQITQLKQENSELEKENSSLRTDPGAIEQMAREQMHLVKPGEKIYTLPDKTPATPTPAENKK